jgi:hypothetical protein
MNGITELMIEDIEVIKVLKTSKIISALFLNCEWNYGTDYWCTETDFLSYMLRPKINVVHFEQMFFFLQHQAIKIFRPVTLPFSELIPNCVL